MKFSIIIPVYKVESFLHQCVDSILSQSYTDYEIILVDDGSPDQSPLICDDYAAKNNNIKVIHKPNGGLSSARNAGLDCAKGEYVLFLDSDDWWDDANALRKISDKLDASQASILVFGMKKYFALQDSFGDIRIPKISTNQASSQEEYIEQLMKHNIYIACACDKVVRRSLLECYKHRFVIGQLSEDIEWCVKLLLTNPKIDILEEAFYVYRQQNANSITANITRKNVHHVHDIIVKYATRTSSLPLKHYLANQLVLLLSFSRKVKPNEISDLMNDIKKYWWLLDYNWYPYVRKVSKLKFLGFSTVRFLLGCYHKYKRG